RPAIACCPLSLHDALPISRGFFITFEGGEGAGKSTQIALLAQKLQDKHYSVVMTREPGGSPGVEAIRHVILSGAAEPLGPEMEADRKSTRLNSSHVKISYA